MLVVDDNATNRQGLEEMLASWRMTPTVGRGRERGAADAAAPHRQRAGGQFDVVISDGQMPDVDGLYARAAIRTRSASRRHRAVVMLAFSNRTIREMSDRRGARSGSMPA